jgi:hypothetical protein
MRRRQARKRMTLQSVTEESQDRSSSPMEGFGQQRISKVSITSGNLRDGSVKVEEIKEESEEYGQTRENDGLMYMTTFEKKEELKNWMRKKYKIKILHGVKILFEELV